MQADPLVGTRVDDFIVETRIGRGGMATVYRAHQPSVKRAVALKVITLDPSLGRNSEFARRFEQEANVIASLEHIHVLPVYDYGIIDGEIAYIAMRLLRGGSLADLLRDDVPLEFDRAAEIFTQVARGLHYAHLHGVVHRDLKPSNILLDDAGNAYLTDFGLAKLVENSLEITASGNIVGTPTYMSPEQLRGEPVNARSDIYSLGVILYHMLVGKPPFESDDQNMVSVIYQQLEKLPPPPHELNPDVPPAVEAVILQALAKTPETRFSSAAEMADALNKALGRRTISTTEFQAVKPVSSTSLPQTVVNVPSVAAPPVKPRRSQPLIIGVSAAILLIVVIGGILLARQNSATIALPTVLADTSGVFDDTVPTSDEIARARAHLGSTGFIANIACTQDSEYHATQIREMSDMAEGYGLPFRIYNSEADEYRQITQIEQARTEGATALIVCPLDAALLTNTLTSAQQARLPLVLLASDMPSYGGVLLAGDDYLMGLVAGRAAGALVNEMFEGRGRVVILDYATFPNLVLRANGLEDGLDEVADNSFTYAREPGATRENGYETTSNFIQQGVDFNVILSINDAGSYGAIQALEEANISPDEVIIASIDAEALARRYIEEGYYLRASTDIGRTLFSEAAVNTVVKLLAGSTLNETYLIPPGEVVTAAATETSAPAAEATDNS